MRLPWPLQSFDGQQIALGKASTDSCEVVLTYRNGLQDISEEDEDSSGKYGIETGVPEIDKLDALEAIAKILNPLGIKIFDGYTKVPSKHKLDDTASRMINLPTLLGGVLEALETNSNLEFTAKYLDQLDESQIKNLLLKHFDIPLEGIEWGRKALEFNRFTPNQTNALQNIIQANQAAMQRLYPNEQPRLFIFYEAELQTEAELLQKITQVLWRDTVEIKINRLPANTHGPREVLPSKDLKNKERSRQRIKAWDWLADSRINANQINLGQQSENMQDEWQGARLIRIRQELAPGIIEKKARHLIETSLEDIRTKEELNKLPPTLKIDSASSSTGLFGLSATNQTGCVAYLSVARELPHQYLRGQSCYRSTQTLAKQTGLKISQLSTKAPFVGRWPSPNPLEIVVTLRQPEDNPDDLAALVESLRYGFGHYSDWTGLPAPLFFERVVRDYISEFAIADEDIELEQD